MENINNLDEFIDSSYLMENIEAIIKNKKGIVQDRRNKIYIIVNSFINELTKYIKNEIKTLNNNENIIS
jgi:uncharacterized protein YeeX (DUF496 family)